MSLVTTRETLSSSAPLSLFSSASLSSISCSPILDDEEFHNFTSPSHETTEHDTISFADKLIDIDFLLLDISARSAALPSLACNRKRALWKTSRLSDSAKKRGVEGGAAESGDEAYIDVTEQETPAAAADPSPKTPRTDYKPNRFHPDSLFRKHHTTARKRIYPRDSSFTLRESSRDFTLRETRDYSRSEPTREELTRKLKEGGSLNAREEMNLLRLSCTCQVSPAPSQSYYYMLALYCTVLEYKVLTPLLQARNTGKSTHLWEFLLEMLADKRMRSLIAWTGHAREFKVVNSREVAREWGNRKNKPHMNFDKMSRAMRYYYKKNILTHGNKQRLVYSFCQNSICPHYDKIIKLALRTRPPVQGQQFEEADSSSSSSSWSSDKSTVWDRASPPLVKNSASQKLRVESEKMLTQKLCPQPKNWRRPEVDRNYEKRHCGYEPGKRRCEFETANKRCGMGDVQRVRQGEARQSEARPSEVSRARPGEVGRTRPGEVRKVAVQGKSIRPSEQAKIKISQTKLSANDCFRFC